MRPLAYAALLVALAGCSLPYQGTSFSAQPGLEAELHGRGGEKTAGAEGEHGTTAEPGKEVGGEVMGGEAAPSDATSRTGVVFPATAQPASGAVATRLPAEPAAPAPGGPAPTDTAAPADPGGGHASMVQGIAKPHDGAPMPEPGGAAPAPVPSGPEGTAPATPVPTGP